MSTEPDVTATTAFTGEADDGPSTSSALPEASGEADRSLPMARLSALPPDGEDGPPADDGVEEDEVWQPVSSPEEIPEPPEDIVRAARLAPDNYLYLPDPYWKGTGVPPLWAVVGRWRSDDAGEIAGWEDNLEYRPSPEALGWLGPADDTDRAVQSAVTGYGPARAVATALAAARIEVFLDAEGRPRRSEGPDGDAVVTVFSPTPELREADLPPHRPTTVPELLAELREGEQVLYLSPTSPVSVAVPADVLRQVLAEDGADQAPAGDDDGAAGEAEPTDGTGGEADSADEVAAVRGTTEDVPVAPAGGLVGGDSWHNWVEEPGTPEILADTPETEARHETAGGED
ncbi:type VII secretion system-associated protein [Streptomyces sp. NPDC094143]|uniref:type VII secretion system-associated protein n=1 Tax=Streptomyces sp. NPDC094143 TaxID=3155310 RepID=UPI00331A23C5